MRIFTSFLIILLDIFLWLLPYSSAIYDFRTDTQTDSLYSFTPAAFTDDDVILSKSLYNDDVQTIVIYSDLYTDAPFASSYNSSARMVTVSGLTDNTSRTLEVDYDVASFDSSGALSSFLDKVLWFWMLLLVIFPVAAIAYIWWGKITGME